MRFPLKLVLSKAVNSKVFSYSSWDIFSIPFTVFAALPWPHSRNFISFLNLGPQNCIKQSKRLQQWCHRGRTTTFDKLVMLLLMHSRMWFDLLDDRMHSWLTLMLMPAALLDTFLQDCSPASPLPVYTCGQSHLKPDSMQGIAESVNHDSGSSLKTYLGKGKCERGVWKKHILCRSKNWLQGNVTADVHTAAHEGPHNLHIAAGGKSTWWSWGELRGIRNGRQEQLHIDHSPPFPWAAFMWYLYQDWSGTWTKEGWEKVFCLQLSLKLLGQKWHCIWYRYTI